MSEHVPEHDPRSPLEDEGIPDLQDGSPEQQWAVDPQQAPVPGDEPVAVTDYGTTGTEEVQGEPLDGRLRREVPEEEAQFGVDEPPGRARQAGTQEAGARQAGTPVAGAEPAGAEPPAAESSGSAGGRLTGEGGLGVGADLDTRRQPDAGVEPEWPAQPEEPSGQVWDNPRRAGRLVAPDEGVRDNSESDEVGEEVGPDSGGYSAEETAMRVEPEERREPQ